MEKSSDRRFVITINITYSEMAMFDGEPEPVNIPSNLEEQLLSNVKHCVARERLLNDEEEWLEIKSWDATVATIRASTAVNTPRDSEEDIAAYRRGYNWASEHGWEDEHEE